MAKGHDYTCTSCMLNMYSSEVCVCVVGERRKRSGNSPQVEKDPERGERRSTTEEETRRVGAGVPAREKQQQQQQQQEEEEEGKAGEEARREETETRRRDRGKEAGRGEATETRRRDRDKEKRPSGRNDQEEVARVGAVYKPCCFHYEKLALLRSQVPKNPDLMGREENIGDP